MTDKIPLRCERCGNAMLSPRSTFELDTVREVSTSFCILCETGGEFEETFYTLRDGRTVGWPQLEDMVYASDGKVTA